jgi:hypothetical protein
MARNLSFVMLGLDPSIHAAGEAPAYRMINAAERSISHIGLPVARACFMAARSQAEPSHDPRQKR